MQIQLSKKMTIPKTDKVSLIKVVTGCVYIYTLKFETTCTYYQIENQKKLNSPFVMEEIIEEDI